MEDTNNAAAIIEFAKAQLGGEVGHADGPDETLPEQIPFALVPKGLSIQSLKPLMEEWREHPKRVEGTAELQTIHSFIEHANRFKGPHSSLFCDWTSQILQVVIDYHQQDADDRARWCKHRGRYKFPLSEEWKAWSAVNGKTLPQQQFAEFIEDRLVDVRDPDEAGEETHLLCEKLLLTLATPSRVLELSRGLSVKDNVNVKSAITLASGEVQFTYESQHTDSSGNQLKIPRAFLIALPVFLGDTDAYPIVVRLRYRIGEGGRVSWILLMHRAEVFLRDAVQRSASAAQAATELPLFWGRPERTRPSEDE
jgi:uncharacterized protein YfdQ (DUF2303 family)